MIYDSASIPEGYYYNEGQELRDMGHTHAPCLILVDSSAYMVGVKKTSVEHAINCFF